MDTPTIYTLASTAWLTLQSLPLLFTPKLIITLLAETDTHVATSTEVYFARLLAIAQLSIIVFSLLPSAASSGTSSQQQQQPPYALTFTHVASFVYIYAHYTTLYVPHSPDILFPIHDSDSALPKPPPPLALPIPTHTFYPALPRLAHSS
jgi:hypothetical protein